jgi:hypothetical protein
MDRRRAKLRNEAKGRTQPAEARPGPSQRLEADALASLRGQNDRADQSRSGRGTSGYVTVAMLLAMSEEAAPASVEPPFKTNEP